MDCLTQKIELNVIIPAIRKGFIETLEKKDLSDADISRRLDITKAAVSQYKHRKRGKKIKFNAKVKKEIEKSANEILNGKNADFEISRIIGILKKSREICIICKKECSK